MSEATIGNSETRDDALFSLVKELEAANVAARQALEAAKCENARMKAFIGRALEACRNAGRGNAFVAERIIERIEAELLSAIPHSAVVSYKITPDIAAKIDEQTANLAPIDRLKAAISMAQALSNGGAPND